MKTGIKLFFCTSVVLLGASLCGVSASYAEETPSGDLGMLSSGITVPDGPEDVESAAPAKKKKKKSSTEDIADSVQNVIDRLNTETENVSLEDLNAAREAIVKLDVLIDIEKRLNDLSKLRGMRDTGDSLAAAIPSSALQPPVALPTLPAAPIAAPVALPQRVYTPPAKKTSSGGVSPDIEVIRITGAGGSYLAEVKDAAGTKQAVREGDHLDDGTRVVLISSKGVTFKKNDDKETIQVKDVMQVFSR